MKFRTKILLITLSLILATGAISTVVSQIVTKNVVQGQILSKLETIAESRAEQVESFLEAQKVAVEELSKNGLLRAFLSATGGSQDYLRKREEVTRILKATTSTERDIYDAFLLDNTGLTVASTVDRDIGKDRSHDASFLSGQEGVFIKDAHVVGDRKAHCLAFSAPLPGQRSGDFLGVVVIRYSMEVLNRITTDRTGLGLTGEVYLVSQDGYLLTPSRFLEHTFLRERVNTSQRRKGLDLLKHLGPRQYGVGTNSYKNYLGRNVLGVRQRIPAVNWWLLAEVSEKEASAAVATLGQVMPSVLWVLSVAAIIVSVLLSGKVTKPISRLHRGTQEVVSGNLDYKVGMETGDELGELSRAFDRMTASLREFRLQVEEYQKTLEAKVEARTRQLAEVNRGLRQEVEERKRAETAIKRRLELEKAISFISSRLLATVDIDDAINASLRDIGRFSGASRALVCLFSPEVTTMEVTHEWCAAGVRPEMNNLGKIPTAEYRWWMNKLRAGETIQIENLSQLPPEAEAERLQLEQRGLRSLVAFPLSIRGLLAGFVVLVNVFETAEWGAEGSAILGMFADTLGNALERKRAEEELKLLSIQDELTGLYNRRGFFLLVGEQLILANRHQRDGLLVFADLDGLKRINDTYGHGEGDRALLEVAQILNEVFRESDIKARIGGDEFAVFAVEAYRKDHQTMLSRLEESLKAHNATAERPYECWLSVGIVPYDGKHPCTLDELLTRADALMYTQKLEKRERIPSLQPAR